LSFLWYLNLYIQLVLVFSSARQPNNQIINNTKYNGTQKTVEYANYIKAILCISDDVIKQIVVIIAWKSTSQVICTVHTVR